MYRGFPLKAKESLSIMIFELPDAVRAGLTHREGTMRKYPILLIAWGLSPGVAMAATPAEQLRAALTSALGNYCIPRDTSICDDSELIATYDKGICKCNCLGMIYNSASRQCEDGNTSCSTGSILTATNASACPTGFILVSENSGSCAAG
jgi:hypothetical protein